LVVSFLNHIYSAQLHSPLHRGRHNHDKEEFMKSQLPDDMKPYMGDMTQEMTQTMTQAYQ